QAGAGVVVTKHLDIAAKRDRAEFPARSSTIPPAEQLRAKADREHLDTHSVPARNQVMPSLVNKDEDGQDHQKRDNVGQTVVKKVYHRKLVCAVARAEVRESENPAANSRAAVSKL